MTIKKYERYKVRGLLEGENVIKGVDRIVHHMPWLNASEIAQVLGVKPDSVRSAICRAGDKLSEMQLRRIEDLVKHEFESSL